MTTFRTTPAAVAQIIETVAGTNFVPFIEVANNVVNNYCVNHGYDGTTLELIERWLAAHFLAVMKPKAIKEVIGEAEDDYGTKIGEGFRATRWGNQATRIEFLGFLSRADVMMDKGEQRRQIGIVSLGSNNRFPWKHTQPGASGFPN